MTTPAWIGLGSNLGDRRAILCAALDALGKTRGVAVDAVSSFHETRPVGGPPGQGPFLNAAARLETNLDPYQLLAALQEIEGHAGRVRTIRWGERTLDLDLLIYGTKFLDTKELKLPHPRLAFRRFVLEPLAEIAPAVEDVMTKRTIADLLANLDRKPRLIAIDGATGRRKAEVFGRLVEALPGFGISEVSLGPSETDETDDPHLAIAEGLERKARAIKSGEALGCPWIVSDYFLDFDRVRAVSRNLWKERPGSELEARARLDGHREWKERVIASTKAALPPTFVVILPDHREPPRRPGMTTTPRLWPESDKPDAIVGEILATCRGIEDA